MKVLIVDDDEVDREAVRRAFQAHRDVGISEAGTCAAARAALGETRFDAILMDYNLPDRNALSCLLDLRAQPDAPPIIVLTGQGDEKVAVEVMRAGATDYLPKADLTPALLDRCLRGALRYHQSQEQVRLAQEALQLRDRAIAAASNGIVIADPHQPDCPIIYVNPAFTAITGYASEEVLGRNCRFLQGPDTDAETIREVHEGIQAERECQVVLKNYKKDGALFWNQLTVSPVRDASGAVTHFIGIQTDITAQRHAEEETRLGALRQQALLRDMFASVTEGRLRLCASADDLPSPLTPLDGTIALSAQGGIRELRQQTLRACLAAGIPDDQRYDLETAVGEAAMNAVVHATTGLGRVFWGEKGAVQVWVEDGGKGIAVENLPHATLQRGYSSAGTMGHGFKMILQTTNRVFLLTGAGGTTVVLEQDRTRALPDW